MLVYTLTPSDKVLINKNKDYIQLELDSIINRRPIKQIQLNVTINNEDQKYLLKQNDSFSFFVDGEILSFQIGKIMPSKTMLYIVFLENASFKFIKGEREK